MVISFQPNSSQTRLFSKRHSASFGFAVALLLSFLLMVMGDRYAATVALHRVFSLMVAPIQYAVDYPLRVVAWTGSLITTKQSLIDENRLLRHQQLMLEAQLQQLALLHHENAQLKQLLSVSSMANTKAMAAHILAVDTTPSRQVLILNKGSRDGVFVGQPVLDAKGVMGQIIDVGLMTSTVLLISDAKCAVPVQNHRTGERSILVGTNSMTHLLLIHLPGTSLIAKGDLLVTSGLGRRYPEGYPVGLVESVMHKPGDEFMTVRVTPVARLNRNRLVLLIWPEKEYNELTEQINERMKILEGMA